MSRRIWVFSCILIFLSFFFSGCFYFNAVNEMKAAQQSFNQLQGAGGAKLVPYEYALAESYLQCAQIEFSEPGYKPATEFAKRSKAASQAGLAEIQKKK